jgi:predicted PurR-regulated permease PerM
MPAISRPFSLLTQLQVTILVLLLLYWGKALLIPLSFAWLMSIILYPVCRWLERKGLGRSLAIGLSLAVVLVISLLLLGVVAWQLAAFRQELPGLLIKAGQLLDRLQAWTQARLHISLQQQVAWFENALMNVSSNLGSLLMDTVNLTLSAGFFLVMVPLFTALILNYRALLVRFLYALLPPVSHPHIGPAIHQTIHVYYNYVKGLLLIYLVVAVLNSAGLALLGIKHALLYGTLASLLTIIPYVGISIGALLPITAAWLTYDLVWYPLGVILWFSIVQYLEANVIFPWIIGQRLRVNTLASLVALFLGGMIWGASGMVLFLPLVAILKIIAEHMPAWKPLAILLGTGESTASGPENPPDSWPDFEPDPLEKKSAVRTSVV